MDRTHVPDGNPCSKCGRWVEDHLIPHAYYGEHDTCARCGFDKELHQGVRPRTKEQKERAAARQAAWRAEKKLAQEASLIIASTADAAEGEPICPTASGPTAGGPTAGGAARVGPSRDSRSPAWRRRGETKPRIKETYYVGIDGEGIGRDNHRYVYLGANDRENKLRRGIENLKGLSTIECLEFLLNLPKRAKCFTYAFNYDLTLILKDLPPDGQFFLPRPDARPRFKNSAGVDMGPPPLLWNGYTLNLQGTKFTVSHGEGKTLRKRIVWDIFKFFQGKFVKTLKEWKVGSEALWARMQEMKEQRDNFEKVYRDDPEKVKAYCLEECQCMAELAATLTRAHEDIGLKLTQYYGAGSSATAMLKAMNIKDKLVPIPPEMSRDVACAFFGGRFENSVIGEISGEIHNWDISSAYPYHLTFLPCLLHGKWTPAKRRKDIERPNVRAALVKYGLGRAKTGSWGPFPHRNKKGQTKFPLESGGGHVWLSEYLAGEKAFPNVQYKSAWIYESECTCQPFADIPKYYAQRLRIGKEARGLCLKLGCNSCYGKLAQSIGQAQFNSWIWAGMITAGCRAQILDVIGMHKDRANLLMVATDGIYTREKLKMPKPRETGTGFEYEKKDSKGNVTMARTPLGGWEYKLEKHGVFIARPGIYFPTNPTESDLANIRARGIGKTNILAHHALIRDTWRKHGIVQRDKTGEIVRNSRGEPAWTKVVIGSVPRFFGMKTSVHRVKKGDDWEYIRAGDKEAKERKLKLIEQIGLSGFTPELEKLMHDRRVWVCQCPVADLKRGHRHLQSSECKEGKWKDPPAYGQWSDRDIEMSFNPNPKRWGLEDDGITLTVPDVSKTLESVPYKKAYVEPEDVPPEEEEHIDDVTIEEEQPGHGWNDLDTADTDGV